MNITQFKSLFAGESLPLELAYGYTAGRETLHLILFEDKISRIETDHYGNVVYRIDQSEKLNLEDIVHPHKRFYPNRVNKSFKDIMNAFGVAVSVTNQDSKSEPIFEFGEVLTVVPREEATLKYFKLRRDSEFFDHKVRSNDVDSYFFEHSVMGQDLYAVGDAKKNYKRYEEHYEEISEQEYNNAKNAWDTLRKVGNYKIERHWVLENSDKEIIEGPTEDIQSLAIQRVEKFQENESLSNIVSGYVILDHNDDVIEPQGINYGFHHNFIDALLRAYEVRTSGMESKNRYFMSINDKETEKYWVYEHPTGTFENDTHIYLWAESVPGEVIHEANKDNFREIHEFEHHAIINAIDSGFPNASEVIEKVFNRVYNA